VLIPTRKLAFLAESRSPDPLTRYLLTYCKVCDCETAVRAVLFFMVALCDRADHYIFALWFLLLSSTSSSSLLSSPNLNGRRVDAYHTSTHGVALVRI